MATPDSRPLSIATLILAGLVIGLPWAVGGKSPVGHVSLVSLLVLAGAIGVILGGPAPRLRPSPALLVAALLVVVSASHTIHPDQTVQTLLLLLSYLLAASLAAQAGRVVPWGTHALLSSIATSGPLVTLVGAYRVFFGHEGGLYGQVLTGPFGYPNAAAGFFVLTAGAALALVRENPVPICMSNCESQMPSPRPQIPPSPPLQNPPSAPLWQRGEGGDFTRMMSEVLRHVTHLRSQALVACRAGALVAALLSVLGLVLTRSQGAMLAAAIGFTVWAAMDRNAWWSRRRAWATLGALGLLLTVALAPNRLLSLPLRLWTLVGAGVADSSYAWRLHIWEWTLAMIRDHPWWGVGPGAFPVALTHYQRIPYVSGQNPHNLYLEVAAEYGLPAAILVVVALGIFLGRVGVAIQRTPAKDPARGQLAVLLATLIAFAVHSLVDLDWSFPVIALTAAIMLGLASSHLVQTIPRGTPVRSLWRGTILTLLLAMALMSLSRYYARSLVNWAQLSLASQDVALAQNDLTWALRLNPFSFSAHRSMATARLRSGDPKEAIEVAVRAARLAPLDPNSQFLAGEIAASLGRWDLAEERFRAAVDRAPSAQLRFHAGLIEAAAYGGKPADARDWYERTTEIFAPERVMSVEARCLAPGDRYLLARLSRLVARLYAEAGDPSRHQMLVAKARLLAEPDRRGICITQGRPGQTSPEAAMEDFWRALADGGWPRAAQFLPPENRHPEDRSPWLASETGEKPRQARVAWIAALSGGEYQANLRFQLEIEDSRGERIARCAQGDTRLIGSDWFLERPPVVQRGPCPE